MEKNSTHPQVVNFAGDILEPYLVDGCAFRQQGENQKKISYNLVNDQCVNSHVDSHERTVQTVLMCNGYWLYCGFEFFKLKNNRKELKHFALHFFDDVNPLFRAEWACLDIPESKKHAQPHWHLDARVNMSAEKLIVEKIPSFDEFKKQQSALRPQSVDLGRAHFFMNWNLEREKDDAAPYLDFRNEGIFKLWLAKTMPYVDKELRALRKR